MSAASVVWCDPPSQGKRTWVHILGPCLDQPKRWGMVREYSRAVQAQCAVTELRRAASGSGRKGGAVIPAGGWEFAWGQLEENHAKYGLWARWLG